MNNDVRKYLGYAGGEIALIIAGILIALQMDAWYEDEKVRKELNAQLDAVAASISQDATQLTQLKQLRIDAIFNADRLFYATGPEELADEWYTQEYVQLAAEVVAASQVPRYLIAGTGAYQVLEASGNANHIRDDRLRTNLLDYYATVDRVAIAEREMNRTVRDLTLRYQIDATRGLFEIYLREPLLAWQPSELEGFPEGVREFQASYRRLLTDSVTLALLRSGRNQPLLKEYEHLLTLGDVLLSQIHAYLTGASYPSAEGKVFHPAGVAGPPAAIVGGRVEAHTLGLFTAPAPGLLRSRVEYMRLDQDYLNVSYPGGEPWQFLFLRPGTLDITVRRPSLDYSPFDRIRLELRRYSGCDDLRLVLKDAKDADDGSQANVRLELSDQWKVYDYDLSRFSDADLAELHVVTGFLMDEAPCSFAIRDVRFLQPGEPVQTTK
jgi:hypothetical protein